MKNWGEIYADILHIYFSPFFRELPASEFDKVAPRLWGKRLKKIGKLLYHRWKNIFRASLSEDEITQIKHKTWLFVQSRNNVGAIGFLQEELSDAVFIFDKRRPEFLGIQPSVVPILRFQFLYCLCYFYLYPLMLWKYGLYAQRFSVVLLKACGYYEEWRRILRMTQPKAIVFSNDHNIESRSLLLAANSLGVKTIYIQHASVSTSFPQLRFGLSLLEGQDAWDKYKSIGVITGEVKLVGMPKFDTYILHRRSRGEISRIGIPYNLNDDPDVIRSVVRALHENFPHKQIVLRSHPKDKSPVDYKKEFSFITVSDPFQENSFDFLKHQDLVIAGNTSIHLEATLLNIPAIYFDLGGKTFIDDYYGYVKNKLVVKVDTVYELITRVKEFDITPSDVWMRAKYFNSLVGDSSEGYSKKLVIGCLKHYI